MAATTDPVADFAKAVKDDPSISESLRQAAGALFSALGGTDEQPADTPPADSAPPAEGEAQPADSPPADGSSEQPAPETPVAPEG